jgi:hypothetical protein
MMRPLLHCVAMEVGHDRAEERTLVQKEEALTSATATAGPSGTASTRRTTGFAGFAINDGIRMLTTRLTALRTLANTSQARLSVINISSTLLFALFDSEPTN